MRIIPKITLDEGEGEIPTPDEMVSMLLDLRDVMDPQQFLHPPHPQTITLGQLDPGLQTSCEALIQALEPLHTNEKMIVVYTDYDADGVTGGAIMWEALHIMGFKVRPYVPHRVHEGYGFSIKGIDNMKQEFDPALIISVDHGITAEEKIVYARGLGIPVVVTDHHLKPEAGPPVSALAVFHIPALSGSGVAYVVARFIYDHFKHTLSDAVKKQLDDMFQTDYLCLASIGSVADLVPLVGPTRSIVYHGLEAFAKTKRVGLLELMKQAGIAGRPVTPYEIGFVIAPRINAIGRLEHALDALRLLCTPNLTKAQELTQKLAETNTKRQDLVASSIEEALVVVEKEYGQEVPPVLIVQSDSWHEGIIGLIASKLVEKYYRPTIVMTRGDGFYKASARSIPALHMTNLLRANKSFLVDVGGHAQAAGFTIKVEQVDAFKKAVVEQAAKLLDADDLIPTVTPDMQMPLSYCTIELAHELSQMRPFGIGNPTPTFVSTTTISAPRTIGREGAHLSFSTPGGMGAIAFGKGKMVQELISQPNRTIVYQIDVNEWQGQSRLQAKVQQII